MAQLKGKIALVTGARGIGAARMGEPADYIGAATFLASNASAYVTGQTLNVDGGLFLH